MPIKVVFFDLGDTLGVGSTNAKGIVTAFEPFPFVKEILKKLKDPAPAGRGLRLGVISNTPTGNTDATMRGVLAAAGIVQFFDPALLLYSSVEGMDKTKPELFKRAATKGGVPAAQCVFVGEDADERKVAASIAMAVSFHALHLFKVLKAIQ
jgi:FMN phosphatase YigB (HAD superfamily)